MQPLRFAADAETGSIEMTGMVAFESILDGLDDRLELYRFFMALRYFKWVA